VRRGKCYNQANSSVIMNRPPARQEHTFWTSLGRIAREALHVVFFVGTHWAVRWVIAALGEQHTWWAPILENGTAIFAVVGILALGGIELIVDIILAVRDAIHRIRHR
jgi:hypothetical protein